MDKSSPFFSIIIPVYNRIDFLSTAIGSVLDQQIENWEVIVIDDGSTEDIKSEVESFQSSKIKYLRQANQGPAAARNLGMAHAQGQFFCFLDSDDYYLPNHLTLLYQTIKEKDYKVAVYRTGMLTKNVAGKVLGKTPLWTSSAVSPVHFFAIHAVGTNTICIHQRVFQKIKFDSRFRNFEDTHFFLRSIAQFPFFQIKEYTCVCLQHEGRGGTTMAQKEEYLSLIENNVQAIKDLFEGNNDLLGKFIPPDLPAYLYAEKYLSYANQSLLNGKLNFSLQLIAKARREDPKLQHRKLYIKFFLKFPLYAFLSLFKMKRT